MSDLIQVIVDSKNNILQNVDFLEYCCGRIYVCEVHLKSGNTHYMLSLYLSWF